MSCGLRDVTNLEIAGRPALLVHTDAFGEAAQRQAEMLGQPGIRRVHVPHPVQQENEARIRALAPGALEQALAALQAASEIRPDAR